MDRMKTSLETTNNQASTICHQAESSLYDVTASLAEASARKDFAEVTALSRLCWTSAYAL